MLAEARPSALPASPFMQQKAAPLGYMTPAPHVQAQSHASVNPQQHLRVSTCALPPGPPRTGPQQQPYVTQQQQQRGPQQQQQHGPQQQHGQQQQQGSQQPQVSLAPKVPTPFTGVATRSPPEAGLLVPTPARGLHNLGNTCFMNSVLQCLAHAPAFAHDCASQHHSDTCRVERPCVACVLEQTLMCLLRGGANGPGAALTPKALHSLLPKICSTFLFGRQEDAHEYLVMLLDAVERYSLAGTSGLVPRHVKRLSKTKPTSRVGAHFEGVMRGAVTCASGHCSATLQPFTTLSLDIDGLHSVEDSLAEFTKTEPLAGANQYLCETCACLVDAHKQVTLLTAPPILVLHFKRFDGLFGGKIRRAIQFGKRLDLSPYMTPLADVAADTAAAADAAGTKAAKAVSVHSPASPHSGASTHTGAATPQTSGAGTHTPHTTAAAAAAAAVGSGSHTTASCNGAPASGHSAVDPGNAVSGPGNAVSGPGNTAAGAFVAGDMVFISGPDNAAAGALAAGDKGVAAGNSESGDREDCLYMLHGVLVHRGGSARSGHYYAYVRSQGAQGARDITRWTCMDDSGVNKVPWREVAGDQAYMLFYSRYDMFESEDALDVRGVASLCAPREVRVPSGVNAGVHGALSGVNGSGAASSSSSERSTQPVCSGAEGPVCGPVCGPDGPVCVYGPVCGPAPAPKPALAPKAQPTTQTRREPIGPQLPASQLPPSQQQRQQQQQDETPVNGAYGANGASGGSGGKRLVSPHARVAPAAKRSRLGAMSIVSHAPAASNAAPSANGNSHGSTATPGLPATPSHAEARRAASFHRHQTESAERPAAAAVKAGRPPAHAVPNPVAGALRPAGVHAAGAGTAGEDRQLARKRTVDDAALGCALSAASQDASLARPRSDNTAAASHAAGHNAAGHNAASHNAAGRDVAGLNAAGRNAAGHNAAGHSVAGQAAECGKGAAQLTEKQRVKSERLAAELQALSTSRPAKKLKAGLVDAITQRMLGSASIRRAVKGKLEGLREGGETSWEGYSSKERLQADFFKALLTLDGRVSRDVLENATAKLTGLAERKQ